MNRTPYVKHILIALSCLFFGSVRAQEIIDYELTLPERTYTPLENATEIAFPNDSWYKRDIMFPGSFTFKIFEHESNITYISGEGVSFANKEWDIFPYLEEMAGKGLVPSSGSSKVSYVIEGEEGSRILKIQWENVGFYLEYELNSTLNDYINYQLWLYEEDLVIEMCYGSSDYAVPYANGWLTGPQVLIGNYLDLPMLKLNGPAAAPSKVYNEHVSLTGVPTENLVYRFAPVYASSITEYASSNLNSFLTEDRILNVQLEGSTELFNGRIVDISGKTIRTFSLNGQQQTQVNLAGLSAGLYFVQVNNGQQTLAKKFRVH